MSAKLRASLMKNSSAGSHDRRRPSDACGPDHCPSLMPRDMAPNRHRTNRTRDLIAAAARAISTCAGKNSRECAGAALEIFAQKRRRAARVSVKQEHPPHHAHHATHGHAVPRWSMPPPLQRRARRAITITTTSNRDQAIVVSLAARDEHRRGLSFASDHDD